LAQVSCQFRAGIKTNPQKILKNGKIL